MHDLMQCLAEPKNGKTTITWITRTSQVCTSMPVYLMYTAGSAKPSSKTEHSSVIYIEEATKQHLLCASLALLCQKQTTGKKKKYASRAPGGVGGKADY